MAPSLWKRLEAADTVIIETNLASPNAGLMANYLNLPADQRLSSMLGQPSWASFLKIVRASGSARSEGQLDRLSPLAAGALLLQIQAKADQDIEDGEMPIDQVIFERGRELGKRTTTLETNAEQLEALKAVFTVSAVQGIIKDWDLEANGFEQLKQAFKTGDDATLDAFLKEVPEDMRYHLLEKRNRAWVQKLPSLLGRNTVLAVGAAHFAGPTGLLELLKKEGYTILRLQ